MIASRLDLPLLHDQTVSSSSRGTYTPTDSFASGRPGTSVLSEKKEIALHSLYFRKSYRKEISDSHKRRPLSTEEYFCALAAVHGDIERAIIRLNQRDFVQEIRFVCSPISGIDVKSIVCKLGSGIQKLLQEEQHFDIR